MKRWSNGSVERCTGKCDYTETKDFIWLAIAPRPHAEGHLFDGFALIALLSPLEASYVYFDMNIFYFYLGKSNRNGHKSTMPIQYMEDGEPYGSHWRGHLQMKQGKY